MLLVELDDGAGCEGGDFGVDAEDRLFVDADRGVDDGLGTSQFGVEDHLVHRGGFCLGRPIAADAEDVSRGCFAADVFDDKEIVLRKNDVGLQLVLVERQARRSAASAHQHQTQADQRQRKESFHSNK